ncbi:MAG: polyketide synthase [Acidobacteria bacterium]|nr:MAG: polyketide synthase [Acidobacteriota bacterium]
MSEGVTPEPIMKLAQGFMASKFLFAAAEIGLFEKLAQGPATVDEIASRARLPRRTARILVDAVVSLGLVEREQDRYRNAPVADAFLARRGPVDLGDFLRFWNRLSYPRWERLEEVVRTGKQLFGELEFTKDEQEIFSKGVGAFTTGAAMALAAAYDFKKHRRVIDVGGGTGNFLIVLLGQHPHLEATLMELPAAAAVARQTIAASPAAARIRVAEGDFFRDPLPEGHDAVILANVVHLFGRTRVLDLLRRLRERVPSGARLLMADFWTNAAHTQPAFAALMAGEFLINTGEGDVYSDDDARGWFAETGWRFVERTPLAGPQSLVVAEAAK